jgi:hypothetical protein
MYASKSARSRAYSTLGRRAKASFSSFVGTKVRRGTGVSRPTGTPLRVMTKVSPLSSARIISALSFRNSRWVIVRSTPIA